ncbi:MAG: helix-turn-helix transcriptional regulator [Clostridia bacterium]|nr:helix-turn-helix transcriptional regulator [Clostridia bacterium]
MKVNDAVIQRILHYCNERNISINKLANQSMLTQSTLNNIVNKYTKDVKLLTIIRICAGLEISIVDFFDDDSFKDIDLEL